MKKLILLTTVLLLTKVVLSQGKFLKIQGKWVETSANGEIIECPYQLLFEINKSYKIFNVCNGFDPANPITEEGMWKYDSFKKVITLENRKTHQAEFYSDTTKVLAIHVNNISNGTMLIHFVDPKIQIVLKKMK